MALFSKKSPTLADRRASRDAIAIKLDLVEADMNSTRQVAVSLLVAGGTDTRQTEAEDAIRRAEIHAAVLRNALAEIDAEIVVAEEAARAKAEKAERETTSREINRLADALEKAAAPIPGAMGGLLAAIEACGSLIWPTHLPQLLKNLSTELPATAATFSTELRARAAQTLAGDAPASLPKPFTPEIVPPAPEPPTIQVFTLQNLQWLDGSGLRQNCGTFQIHALLVAAAKTAMRRGLALPPDSERAIAMRDNRNQPHIFDPMKVFDLDRPEGQVAVYRDGRKIREELPNIRAGEPKRTVSIPRGPEPVPAGPNEFD